MNAQTSKTAGGVKRRRSRRRRRGLVLLIALLALAAAVLFAAPRLLGLTGDCSGGGAFLQPALELIPPTPLTIEQEQIYSSCALLVRLRDGAVLYEKNSAERTYPASLTKMMTVLTFLEHYAKPGEAPSDELKRLKSESYTLPREIFPILAAKHASMAGFEPGETVPYLDLLYACHLPSGADGSMGLAYAAAGSEEGFVELMNQKAAELGMSNTHFANVTGLHDPQHYTTAEDLGRLLQYALKNDAFREIFTAKKYNIAPTNRHPDGFTVHSTVYYKMKDMQVGRVTVLGGKTGYTEEAGLCLASLAKKGSQEYILITTNAPGNNYTDQYNIIDAKTIYGSM